MLPTPFVYVTSAPSVIARLGRVGDYSAHVYIAYENNVIMLHSLRYGNVMGPGGKLNPNETVIDGLTRELNEEIPVLSEFIVSRLRDGKAVGMWRQTNAGVHNTFLIEASPADFDAWAKCEELRAVIANEKATQNRPDYLEADGGIVLVPMQKMAATIFAAKCAKSDAKLECYVGPMECDQIPLRSILLPVVEELAMLQRLHNLKPRVLEAMNAVQAFYKHFAKNTMLELDGYPISRLCVSCNINRAIRDDFGKSRYVIMCDKCGNAHASAVRELRRVEELDEGSADITVVACKILEHYE